MASSGTDIESSRKGNATKTAASASAAPTGSPLTKYFLVILFGFSTMSMVLNNKYAHKVHLEHENNAVKNVLSGFKVSHTDKADQLKLMQAVEETGETPTDEPQADDGNGNDVAEGDDASGSDDGNDGDAELHDPNGDKSSDVGDDETDENGDDDGSENKEEKANGKNNDNSNNNANKSYQNHDHKIANLSCEAYGGPSDKDAEEMVYWEDIPEDALHMSPFHAEHPNNKKDDVQPITQYLTFDSDHGGWNNIRMAMETVLTIAFAMGRTLVLPPHQGMYLIDKANEDGTQKRKFSYDSFFHMERIANEHLGFNVITMEEFLELCVQGKVVGTDNKPIHPPNMRTKWDDAPHNEQRQLKMWLRDTTDENLLWDPDNCMAAFPATDSEKDAKDLASLPAAIDRSPGGFPGYNKYIGKPNDLDAPAIERLKEMNADRHQLCEYTPELQKKQWLHFPVGMKTPDGDETRLLVHFYAFLFFQDWKQDLWMKRFVRDHVRYIDEIQCAAARVVTALRKRTSERTKGASTDFDTIHIRRGDFQYKETRVDANKILVQLKKVLSEETTLYIATDERDKSFFKPIVDHFADVVFLDDVLGEIKGINTNYFGMIDQLVASRGKIFFGCWFSTFTGYINRLRGYHADDHELPGYEKGTIPSYYYAMPDRFDHMQEYWPIKQQFYAREFPASWRMIDTSI